MARQVLSRKQMYQLYRTKLGRNKTPLQLCGEGATWTRPPASGIHGAMTDAFNMGVRRPAAAYFATRYLEKHKRLPEGPHRVAVTYGPVGTADIVPLCWPSNRGTLDIEIVFPIIRRSAQGKLRMVCVAPEWLIDPPSACVRFARQGRVR